MTDSPAQKYERRDDKKPRRPGTSFSNPAELVTLEVGPEKKKFIVHKEFACHYSPVPKAAFNSEFIEGQTQTYVLEEATEPVARLLVDWLYTQQLDICRYEKTHPKKAEEGLSLCRLWLLLPGLQNLIVRTIEEIHQETEDASTSCIRYVYENTCEGSPLRKFLLHQCACYVCHTVFRRKQHQFPKEFFVDLAELTLESTNRNAMIKRIGIESRPSQYEVAEQPSIEIAASG
ncbi:hypothetical protein LHYA1_G006973 [Lachnellula hyalina]|uniref:BTB domain-containing protein n=1 Tax=Lachnellula hyalina TaxID=1316788 RepID=A0A8H8QWK0_9HELO|nr:uncharacterized protein LHYA1_G006973 [Lachnellula hyalina]TVY24083.1 hypothetical protein LHYA1_G006973 [Lachnellula hyalina]